MRLRPASTGRLTLSRLFRDGLNIRDIQPSPPPSTTYYWKDATLANGAVVVESDGSSPLHTDVPQYVNFATTAGSSATLENVDGGLGGATTLRIYCALGNNDDRTGEIVINGDVFPITFVVSGGFGIWVTKFVETTLLAGPNNTITLRSTGADLANVHSLIVIAPTEEPPPAPGAPQVFQAEDCTLSGGVVIEEENGTNHTGTGYANFPQSGGVLSRSSIDGGTTGQMRIDVRVALGNQGSRLGIARLNGTPNDITCETTGDWDNYAIVTLYLTGTPGSTNTIAFESNGQDFGNIDRFTVYADTPAPVPVTDDPYTVQTEDMILSGGAVAEIENGPGFTGTAYVNFAADGSKAEAFDQNGGVSGGPIRVRVYYSYDGNTGTRTGTFRWNGAAQSFSSDDTGGWNSYLWQDLYATATPGYTNTFSFESTGDDLPNIDKVEIFPGVAPPPTPAPPPPSPPAPAPPAPAPAPTPVGSINPAHIRAIINPNDAFNTAVGGWSVEWDAKNTSLASVSNTVGSGVLASNTFATGELGQVRFGKQNAPENDGRKVIVLRGHPNDGYTAGAPRTEFLCWQGRPGQLPVKTIFWQAFGVYLTMGFPAGSNFCMAQWHSYGQGVHGYAGQPFFAILLRDNTYSLQHRYNGNYYLSASTTTDLSTGGITAGGAPVGRWDYWIMQACISPFASDQPFLKVWRCIDGTNLTLVHNKAQPLGYSGFDSDDNPFPKMGHYPYLTGNPWMPAGSTRELLMRCPVFVDDPGNIYSPVDLLNYVKTR